MMFIVNLIIFLVSLSVLVFVHELGHFVFAKIFGVYCHEFSLGMGPAIVKRKFKRDTETTYSLRCLPIGGYVAMAGEEIEDEKDEERTKVPYERTINGIKAWKRAIVVVAGAVVNFIFGLILISVVVFSGGIKSIEERALIEVQEDSLAFEAGLRTDDLITRITVTGDKEHTCNTGCDIEGSEQLFTHLSDFKPSEEGESQTINFEYSRGELNDSSSLTRVVENGKLEPIGISMISEAINPGFFEGIKLSFQMFGKVVSTMFKALGSLFTKAGISQLGGPIQIYQVSAEQASQGIIPYVWFVAILSINLGFFNLLPIPGLDGSRFIISIGEMITRRKFNIKVESYLNFIGIILLLLIMVLVTVKDVIGLF